MFLSCSLAPNHYPTTIRPLSDHYPTTDDHYFKAIYICTIFVYVIYRKVYPFSELVRKNCVCKPSFKLLEMVHTNLFSSIRKSAFQPLICTDTYKFGSFTFWKLDFRVLIFNLPNGRGPYRNAGWQPLRSTKTTLRRK